MRYVGGASSRRCSFLTTALTLYFIKIAARRASYKSGTQFARGCLAAMQLSYKTLRILLIQFIQNMFTMAFNLYLLRGANTWYLRKFHKCLQ